MFTWVGNQFNAVLSTYVVGVVSSLMAALAPVALTAMTLWVALYGWALLRGEVQEPVQTFVWKIAKIGFVLAFALQSGRYITHIVEGADALSMGVAGTFLPPGTPASAVTSPYALLDVFNDAASRHASDIMRAAMVIRIDMVLAGVIFSFGSVIFLCIALFVVTLAKVLLTFVLAVGPIFLLCGAWPPTQRFFDSWLSMLLNAVVLAWFAFFALGLSTFMGQQMFSAIVAGGGFSGLSFNVLGESIRYCVLMLMLALLSFQAPSLAAALTGGAVVQQGVQVVQNLLMLAGLRAAHKSAGPAGRPGGVIRSGTGMAYAAGLAIASSGRRVAAPIRTAAYRLAALRGRG
jgi:type IV secretion system protein VirB6